MTTPIYTLDEINAEIAQAKLDLASSRKMLSYSKSVNQLQVQRERIADLQTHLAWLQQQRMQLEGVTGIQSVRGRVSRG